jgi:hypothetical protein
VAVESPLLDAIDWNVTYPSASHGTETINVKQVAKKRSRTTSTGCSSPKRAT